MSRETVDIDTLRGRVGQELGVSEWITIDQDRINQFADVTGDHQFIHVDVERAKRETPFGGTIAHGFLTVSLLAGMSDALPDIANRKMGINYGFNKLRFLSPVPSGARVRAHFTLGDVTERRPGEYQIAYQATVEIEGNDKPALSAEWLTLAVVG